MLLDYADSQYCVDPTATSLYPLSYAEIVYLIKLWEHLWSVSSELNGSRTQSLVNSTNTNNAGPGKYAETVCCGCAAAGVFLLVTAYFC